MRKEAGISIIEIVISIIILIIIAFFAIYNSQNSVPKAKATELYSEMKSVQMAIESVRAELATKRDYVLEQDKHYDYKDDTNNLYTIYGSMNHSDGKAAEYLGLDNLKRDYIVSYDTGDFMLAESVDIHGTGVITLKDVENLIGISK